MQATRWQGLAPRHYRQQQRCHVLPLAVRLPPSSVCSEGAARNANDAVMAPQFRRALAEAQAQLAAAERQHAASHKAIHDKEKLKRMTKL
jgi:hypothetical protein